MADQVNGEEPCSQWQLGLLQQTACGQRSLVAAAVALRQPPSGLAEDAVFAAVATRTTEFLRPSRLLDCCGALRLSVRSLKEICYRHATLDLDLVEGHEAHSLVRGLQLQVH
jgi:hypothetical protein